VIDLSIVIVSWNSRDVLLDCLASIEREIHGRSDGGAITAETLVVDNHSADGTVAAVQARYPWVDLVALDANRGFSGGNNVGLRRARGRYAVLLNPDTVVLPDALECCVRHLDAHPEVGVAGPQLLNPDGSKQNSIHAWPSLLTEIIPKGVLEQLLPGRFPSKRFEHPAPIDVQAVLGACLVVRREVLAEVGLMPEDYFLYLEETDWCRRIAASGWKIQHVPEARVIHVLGASTKKRRPVETRIEYHRSLYHFFRKQRGAFQAGLVIGWRFAKTLVYVVVGALPALFRSRGRQRWQRDLTLLAWHLRGCPLDGWGYPRERPLGDPAPRLEAAP
jgi:GT2 family glycosyltransferase